MSDGIAREISGKVGVVTLDRPEVLNAIDRAMRLALFEAIEAFDNDAKVGAIVLTGRGTRAFSVGGNFNELKDAGVAQAEEAIAAWGLLYKRMRRAEKPIVAAVNGFAVGAGFQLAMLSDIRIGHANVKMGQPEINVGIPTALGPYLMARIVGPARAAELTLTGRLIDAAEAERLGLLHRIVGEGEVLAQALAVAAQLAEKPAVAMALQKQHLAKGSDAGLDEAIAEGRALIQQAYASGMPQTLLAQALKRKARNDPKDSGGKS